MLKILAKVCVVRGLWWFSWANGGDRKTCGSNLDSVSIRMYNDLSGVSFLNRSFIILLGLACATQDTKEYKKISEGDRWPDMSGPQSKSLMWCLTFAALK